MSSEKSNARITRRSFLGWSAAAAATVGLGPLLSACSQPAAPAAPAAPAGGAQAPSGAPTKAVAPTQPPAKAGVIELKLDHHEPATGNLGRTYQAYADYIGEKSGGKIHITVYPSETLSKAQDAYMNCINGVNDLAWTPASFVPGQFPITDAFALPLNGITSAKHGAAAAMQWWKTNEGLRKEWDQIHMIAVYCNGVCFLNAKKAVNKIEDVAGMKIRVTNWGAVQLVKNLGANPVSMTPPETYEGMTKGIIDGYIWDWQGILGNKTYETSKYAMTMPIYNSFMTMIMNKNKYASIPDDLKPMLDSAPGIPWQSWDPDPAHKGPAPSLAVFYANAFDLADAPGLKAHLDFGGQEIKFTPEEVAKWKTAAKPVWDAWVETKKGLGFDPAKELATIQDLIAKAPK